MTTRAGIYRHKITIQERTDVTDSFGQPQPTWSTFKTWFAAVEPLNGRELFTANQFESEVTTRIRMRYLTGVTTKMRISWNGKIYNIREIVIKDYRGAANQHKEVILMEQLPEE